MRPDGEYRRALELIRAGVNDSEIGRRLQIPRGTIRDWRVGIAAGSGGRTSSWSGARRVGRCFRCDGGWLDSEAYAYLLGVYLGDGCLSPHPRDVYRLRIACDLRYPNIIDEIARHVVIIRGVDRVGFVELEGCIEVSAYWKHWPSLFPQHGSGRKHLRKIELADWQQNIASQYPSFEVSSIRTAIATSTGSRLAGDPERRSIATPATCSRMPRPTFLGSSLEPSTSSESIGPRQRQATSPCPVAATLPTSTPLSVPRADGYNYRTAGVAKLAKAMVPNTIGGNPLWVRIPPPAQKP